MTTCPKCGAQFADGTKFCEACGAQMAEAEVVVNTNENVQFQQPQQPEQPQQPQNNAAKIPAKFIKPGAIAVVAVIAVIVLCSLIFSGGKNNFTLYKKDGELFFTNLPKFDPQEITSDFVSSSHVLSKDGKTLFFYDKEAKALYYRDVTNPKKEAEKISSDVNSFEINEKANVVTYLKNYDNEKGVGDLYQHNLKEGNKIKGDVRNFWTSEDGKKILYVDDGNNLYLKNGKKDAEKIKGEISNIYFVSGDLSTIYYAADGTLYCKKGNKDATKIDSDVTGIQRIYETGEVLYMKENKKDEKKTETETESATSSTGFIQKTYTLYYFDGKDKKELTDEFSEYSDYDYALDVPVFIYSIAEETKKDDKVEIEHTYFLLADGETSEITTDDVSAVYISNDGKEVLITADVNDKGYGTVYLAKISGKTMKTPEKYDEDAGYAYFVGEKNDILIEKDYSDKNDKYTLYFNKTKVDDDVYTQRYNKETKELIYFTDVNDKNIGTMKIFNGKKSAKISDDIYVSALNVTNEGNVLFFKDYKVNEEDSTKNRGDLYVIDGKNVKKIDEDVQSLYTGVDFDYVRESKYDRK
ncbi:MAG: zinc ribbon domain-containing protein, partial [Clostridia bacterium]|nr:zinc ribbon domain-containing protein [Clostridia bacterium]